MKKKRNKPPLMRVRVTDSATGRTAMTTIRADELVDVRWHGSLSPRLSKRADALYERVARHLGHTPQAWRDGFCMDAHPEREIAVWEHIADVLEHLWKEKPKVLKRLKRETILQVVVGVSAEWVDIPSQVPGVNDEQVAFIRSVYRSD